MKSVDRRNFTTAGMLTKTHGTRGELRAEIDFVYPINEWAFLEISGKPVPFLVESISGTDESPILKLKWIDRPEQAANLVGCALLAPVDPAAVASDDHDIIGWQIVDVNIGVLGTVEEILEMPGQWLIQTTYNQQELLLPMAFVVKEDKKKKVVSVEVPEGMVEI